MAKTIDELKSAAAVVRDATEEKENTALRIGQLFLDTIETLGDVSTNAIKGYVVISNTSELPTSPTTEQQMKGYLLGTTLYVWVGTGGDTLDGKYQSAQLKGADGAPGAPGEKGDKGDSGVDLGEVVLVNDLTTGGEGNALSAEMGKVLRDMLDEAKEPFMQEHVLCGSIGYDGYVNNDVSCNVEDVFEEDVFLEKVRFNEHVLSSVVDRQDKDIRFAIVDADFKIVSIHSATLKADAFEIKVNLPLYAGQRFAFVSELLGKDTSNRNVYVVSCKQNQPNGTSKKTYANQYRVGGVLSLNSTNKVTGFELIAKQYLPTIVNKAADLPCDDALEIGFSNVQEAIDGLRDNTIVYETLYNSPNEIIRANYGDYFRVTDRQVSDKDEKIVRIEFDNRLLSQVAEREDVTVTWIVADDAYVIRQMGSTVLKADACYIDVLIHVPAGHHIGLKDFIAGKDSGQNDVHGFCVADSGKVETTGHFAYASVGIGGQMNTEKREVYNVRYCTICSLKKAVAQHADEISKLHAIVGDNTVGVADATNCLMLGSSLTDDFYSPKGLGWCDRLNDLVDVNILNGGWTGTSITANIENMIKGVVMHDYTNAVTYRKIPYKVDYLWWGNTANGTPIGKNGFDLLKEAMNVSRIIGAKMLIGTENPMIYTGEGFDANRREFGLHHNVPVSAFSEVASKLKIDSPYAGFSTGVHGGYRSNAFFLSHYDLVSKLLIWKNVKLFKVRPDYQGGSPTVAQLAYDSNVERFRYFTAIAAGCGAYVKTGNADNIDNNNYAVASGDAPALVQEEFELLKGNSVAFNKFCLAEFILDRIRITKATFSADVSVEPTAIYIATKKTSYNNGCTEWVEVADKSYANGVLTANIENKTREIEAFDKVRILLYYSSGEFTLNKPTLYDYDGIKKEPYDLLNGYHNRLYGEELNDKTSVESGWTLNGTSEVKAFPTAIANYSGYNNVKQHIELKADTDTISKTLDLAEPVSKVAVRVVANLFPKIATSRSLSSLTEEELDEYISSTPTVVESGYNYGTLTLLIGGVYEEFLMHPGWQEFYTEVELSNTDASITLTIGRANAVEGFDTNEDFKVLIHDVSVQKIG